MFSALGRRRCWSSSRKQSSGGTGKASDCFGNGRADPEAGRPKIPQAQIDLIRQMANDNPLWGAPRIHGEMLKLGFDLSEATVQRYMPKRPQRTTRQRWKTFLKNHSAQIVSVDFLVVPTITFKLLHVLVFLSHDRRRIIHFNVTDHPTAEWASSAIAKCILRHRATSSS